MQKLRHKLKVRQTKSDLDVPATNAPTERTSDIQSRSSTSVPTSQPKQESLGKRFGYGLKGLFPSGMPRPKSAVEAGTAPSSEPAQLEASSIPDRAAAPTPTPTPLIPTPESIPGASVIAAGPSKETSTTLPSNEVPPKIKIGDTIWHGAKAVLELATEASDALPQLKSVMSGIRAIVKLCEVSNCYDV